MFAKIPQKWRGDLTGKFRQRYLKTLVFKVAPEWPKMALRWLQDGPKMVHDGLKMVQDSRKISENCPRWFMDVYPFIT